MALLILRSILAAVFAVAALGKLADLQGSRAAALSFGVPERLAPVLGTLLPVGEATIAAALLIQPTALIGAACAVALLLTFVVAIGRLMRAGEAPDCHCFGQLHSESAGAPTLIRNAALAVPAVIVLIAGSGRSFAGLSAETLALVLVSVLAAGLALAVAELWRTNRQLRANPAAVEANGRGTGLTPGSPVPELALTGLDGSTTSLRERLTPGRFAVVVHVSPSCGPCRQMLPELARWTRQLSSSIDIISVSSGPTPANLDLLGEDGDHELFLAPTSTSFSESFQTRPTPSAVAVGPRGRIVGRPASGAAAIEELVRTTVERQASAPPGGINVIQTG